MVAMFSGSTSPSVGRIMRLQHTTKVTTPTACEQRLYVRDAKLEGIGRSEGHWRVRHTLGDAGFGVQRLVVENGNARGLAAGP